MKVKKLMKLLEKENQESEIVISGKNNVTDIETIQKDGVEKLIYIIPCEDIR